MLQKEHKNEEGEAEDCTDNAMFTTIAERMLELEPSAAGYRAMGKKELQERNSTVKRLSIIKMLLSWKRIRMNSRWITSVLPPVTK